MLQDLYKIQKWTLILYFTGLLLCLPLFFGYNPLVFIPPLWLKVIHISGVIMFMGNIVIGPLWVSYALNSKDHSIIHFAIKTICRADIFFSIPGVLLVLISGLLLAPHWGGYQKTSWIMASLVLLALSGIPAIPTLRAQYKLFRLSYEFLIGNKPQTKEFQKTIRIWSFWGTIAIILPLISFILMILKPKLW